MRLRTLIAIAVTMCALPALAGELPPAPAPRAVPARVTKVYSVSDILNPADEKGGEKLVRLVASMVRPYSWQERGGRGTAEFYALGSALVLTNTADVQREAGDLLDALRRLQQRAPNPLGPDELARGLATPTAPRAASGVTKYGLRCVPAAEAASALAAHFNSKQLDARVTFDAATNTVLVFAQPDVARQAAAIITALDKQPTQVVVSAMILQVPNEFVERSGLNVGAPKGATSWTLTAREAHMLTELIRAAKQRGDECDVLSRPVLQVSDNQTGLVKVGQDVPTGGTVGGKAEVIPIGVTFRVTPRVKADGGVLLRTRIEIAHLGEPVALTTTVPGSPAPVTQFVPTFNTQSAETTVDLKSGETFVTRVGKALVIVTPAVVQK